MNLTVQALGDTRSWEGKHGPACAIPVHFTDGTQAQYQTKPDYEAKRRAELRACVGVPGEFVLEDGGKWDDGNPKPAKLKDYPGKPESDGGAKKGSVRDETGVAIGAAGHDAATLVAAGITAGSIAYENAAEAYFLWTKAIFLNNQQLRASSTLPEQSAAGAGVVEPSKPAPVPTTSPAGKQGREKTSGSGKGAAGAEREWGAEPSGEGGSVPCAHPDFSDSLPSGKVITNDSLVWCLTEKKLVPKAEAMA